ncbi:YbeD family protein [Chitinilyticum litopenaei]|uniref:YbeD family protein n=1 Tax=Chitinilyticum litopenaei TaxID=1121276 RepID=UPI00040E49EF|nr:DUF493 domain-containing protein [Chitinilyticum litopenaei]
MTKTTVPESARLEDLLDFPALIPAKAVSHKGVSREEFHSALLELTIVHVPGFHAELITIRESSSGNYYSATLSVTVDTADQFRQLDAALRAHPLVKLVL